MTNIVHNNTDQLFQQVSHLIAEARSYVAKTVNRLRTEVNQIIAEL